MLWSPNRKMTEIDRERLGGPFRGLTAPEHEIECRGKSGSIGTPLAVDQEWIAAVLEKVDEDQQLFSLRPADRAQWQVIE